MSVSCNLSSCDVQKVRLQVSRGHRTRQEVLGEWRLRQPPFQSTFMIKLSKNSVSPQQRLESVGTSIAITGQVRGKADFSLNELRICDTALAALWLNNIWCSQGKGSLSQWERAEKSLPLNSHKTLLPWFFPPWKQTQAQKAKKVERSWPLILSICFQILCFQSQLYQHQDGVISAQAGTVLSLTNQPWMSDYLFLADIPFY